jgi:hypothetical protein
MLRCVNDGVTTIIPGHETTGNASVIWSDESSVTLFPTAGRVYVWRTPKETYNPECITGSDTETKGRFSDVLGNNSAGSIITLHGQITSSEYVDRLSNQVHPMIQTLFP